MITYYKQRQIDITKPVYVYRNLHINGFSIKQGGKVVAHARYLVMKDCTFVINKKGQERVRLEQRKNVHAYIYGYFVDDNCTAFYRENKKRTSIYYSPYIFDGFWCNEDCKKYEVLYCKSALVRGSSIEGIDVQKGKVYDPILL